MKKRIFVCHIVPADQIHSLDVSPAGNLFSYNLISGNFFNRVISLVPTNLIGEIKPSPATHIKYIQIRFFPHKQPFKIFNIILENIKLIFSISPNSNIWFYNITSHTFLAFMILRYLRPTIKTFVIVLDFTPPNTQFSLQYFISKLIHHADGVISLAQNSEIHNTNMKIIPGVVPLSSNVKKLTHINNTFLLSGILNENRNPVMILNVFSMLPQLTLIITGIVENEDLFIQYSEKFSNIKYLGYLPYTEYLEVLDSITFCINSRDISFPENRFNFPSKVIEYLLHNKIVISTMSYPQLGDINYFFVELSEKALYQFLINLHNIDKEYLINQYANQSETVISNMGTEYWSKTMNFIEKKV